VRETSNIFAVSNFTTAERFRARGIKRMKYVISYETEFGSISVESENPDELFTAYPDLRRVAARLSSGPQEKRKNSVKRKSAPATNSRVPETTAILRELEASVLSTKFFEEPRTTGETREKLRELTGKQFASRKVSQALGILKDRGKLKRKGKRNFFQYSLS
jgi:hypothetical protein